MIPNAWAGFDFGLGEDIDRLRDTVGEFSRDKITPRADDIDRSNVFPRDLWPQMGALGLLGITVEEELGGSGLGYLAHCVAMEEISRGSASVGLSYGAHSNLCVNQIRRNGSAEQKLDEKKLQHIVLSRSDESEPRKPVRLPVSKATGGLVPPFRSLDEAVAAADLQDDVSRIR